MATSPKDRQVPAPRGLVVERIACDGEELVVFSWEQPTADLADLSSAERDVLVRIVRGDSNAAIAHARGTSARTIANQVASLLRKTGATSRFDLIRRFAGSFGEDER